MKRFLPVIILIAALITVAATTCLVSGETAASSDYPSDGGRVFRQEDRLIFSEVISELPATVEATVKFPAEYNEIGGIIVSNYDSGSKNKPNTVCLYINASGAPVFSVRYDSVDANKCDHTFSEVNLFTGEWVDLAIVRDGTALHCYIDGELKQTLAYTAPEITMTRKLFLGGDYRSSKGSYNLQYFKGAMKSLALYSDARDAEEILADASGINDNDESLVAYYELEGSQTANIIPDLSAKNNVVIRETVTGGLEFTELDNKSKNYYQAAAAFSTPMTTIELMLRADEGEYGVLYGSYTAGSGKANSVNLELESNGAIKFRAYDSDCATNSLYNSVTFKEVNVATGEWVHVAVVSDTENMKYHCYVNGVLKQSLDMVNLLNIAPKVMRLARDNRTGVDRMQYDGEMMWLAAYSDVRTEREIKNDIMRGPEYDENLLCYYDMAFADGSATIPDRSGNGLHMVNSNKPADELAIEGNGITVDTNTLKYTEKYQTESIPHTVEFTVKIDSANTANPTGRTVLSNYGATSPESYSYTIRLMSGIPRLYIYYNDSGSYLEYRFSGLQSKEICTGDWEQVAIVMDTEAKEFRVYVNGVLKATTLFSAPTSGTYSEDIDFDFKFNHPLIAGATYGTGSAARPFMNGQIKSIVTYSDVRTADEIAGDVYFPGTSDMLTYWDASYVGVYKDIPDRSNNFNGMSVSNRDTTTYDNEKEAMTFTKDKYYETASRLDVTPLTFEAMVKYPTYGGGSDAGGKKGCGINNVIFGNYYGKTTANALNFGISNNSPAVFAIDHLGRAYTFIFDEVSVSTEYWEHIAITFDAEAGYAYCYQNGVLMQKIVYNNELSGIDWSDNELVHLLGGDWQSERREYFKRKLAYVALYTDVRDAAEIYADAKDGISVDDEGLICYYDCAAGADDGVISDNKDGKYNVALTSPWVDAVERDSESYDYSIAIVGDTQNLTYSYPAALTTLYDWIVANAESKKIGFVMGVGDINEKDSDAEWILSSAEIEKLRDAGIPQSLVCGGVHDSIPQFNKYLPYTEYVEAYDGKVVYGFYDDGSGEYSLSNAYQLITIGETPYMFLTLEWAPVAGHVAWANEVIAAHPEYNVIISTHAYLCEDGTPFNTWHHATPDGTGTKDAYNGQELWCELVRKHENVVMVVGGHDTSEFVIKNEVYGDHGNRIVQMLINPQHTDVVQKGTGMVAMLYFSDGGRTVDFEYYSTVQKKCYREENQFSFEMPRVETEGGAITQASVSLYDDIRINYYARLLGGYENAVMRFTLNGKTYTATPTATEYDGLYRFTFNGIAPQLMGDVITAELVYGGEVVDAAEEFSIESYLKTLLKKDRYELAVTSERCDALHTLARELLHYGAEAQIYRDYNADSLVNAGVAEGAEFDGESVESVKAQTTPAGDGGVRFKAATVRFDSVNRLRFDFVVGDADVSLITVTIDGKTYTESDFVLSGDGIYGIYTDGITARNFDKSVTATLSLSGDAIHSVTYSVNSYVKAMYNSEKIGALAKAIYNYGIAAEAFINAYS